MEQDIEILEELLNAKITFTISTTDYGWKALEHLIKAYKELEEENKDLKNLANNKQWISPYYVAQNYIPVSLVEEKIEHYKNITDTAIGEELLVIDSKIDVLQELLERKK